MFVAKIGLMTGYYEFILYVPVHAKLNDTILLLFLKEIDRNISSPALLGLLGLRMSYINPEEAEAMKRRFDRENKMRHYYREYSEASKWQ